jgi:hypothetical protein
VVDCSQLGSESVRSKCLLLHLEQHGWSSEGFSFKGDIGPDGESRCAVARKFTETAVEGVEHTIDRLRAALGRRIGDDHAKVLARPDHFGIEAGGGKPSDLVVYGARLVVHAVDWCHDIGRIVGYHNAPFLAGPPAPPPAACGP